MACLLLLTGAAACSEDVKQEQRRDLLRGHDRSEQARQRVARNRVRDPEGALIASETKAAGIVLPRGFTVRYSFDHHWYFDGDLPVKKVEEYFEKRLTVASIDRTPQREVRFVSAREKSTPDMLPALVEISSLPGNLGVTRIHLVETVQEVAKVYSEAEVRQRMAASRATAR